MKKFILITGGSGNLGTSIVKKLCGEQFKILSRTPRPTAIYGDTSLIDWGLETELEGLIKQTTKVIHCAGLTSPFASIAKHYAVNTQSVEVLSRFLECGVPVDHISTLSVFAESNISRGSITSPTQCHPEPDLSNLAGLRYHGNYAKSKVAAEKYLVANSQKFNAQLRIIRPSLVIGNSNHEFINQFNMGLSKLTAVPETLPEKEINFITTEEMARKYLEIHYSVSTDPIQVVHTCSNNQTLHAYLSSFKHEPSTKNFLRDISKLSRVQRALILTALTNETKNSPFEMFKSTGLKYA